MALVVKVLDSAFILLWGALAGVFFLFGAVWLVASALLSPRRAPAPRALIKPAPY